MSSRKFIVGTKIYREFGTIVKSFTEEGFLIKENFIISGTGAAICSASSTASTGTVWVFGSGGAASNDSSVIIFGGSDSAGIGKIKADPSTVAATGVARENQRGPGKAIADSSQVFASGIATDSLATGEGSAVSINSKVSGLGANFRIGTGSAVAQNDASTSALGFVFNIGSFSESSVGFLSSLTSDEVSVATKSLTQGESGRLIRVSSGGFNLSDRTDLILTFTKPSKAQVLKTQDNGEVTLGTVDVDDPDLGLLLANQYVEYFLEESLLDEWGSPWFVCLTYENDTTLPTTIFEGNPDEFEVLRDC